ncbi:MAG: DUF3500 domain-containing protein [Bergeyella sp.]
MKKSNSLIGILAIASFAMMSFIVYDNYNMLVPDSAFSTPKNVESIKNNKNAALSVTTVVAAAQAFKATLNSTQISNLQKTYTATLGRKWSNLPCGSQCRNGIQLSTLTSTQLAAAKAVMQAALGTASDAGYDIMNGILAADDYLNENGGGSGYSSGIYFISFLNEPSTTGAWMLQFGGHHMAFTVSFNEGQVIGTTPEMLGVEPTSFTQDGTAYTPLATRRSVLQTMLAGLSSTELAAAKLTSTFSDCVMSPGESSGGTGTMPSTKVGLAVSTLTSDKQTLVMNAIKEWTKDMDSETEAALNTLYEDGLSGTYIAWTGSGTAGTASTFLNANTNYVRIDGPRVWIELVCQSGVIFPSQIHYHSVWRDHESDYGSDLNGTPLGVSEVVNNTAKYVKIYPNPTSETLSLQLEKSLTNATITVYDVSGKAISTTKNVSGTNINIPVKTLTSGNYVIMVSDKNGNFTAKFIKK